MPLRRTKHSSADRERIAYKFRIGTLSSEQETYFAKTFGCVRWLYNRMLSDKIHAWEYWHEDLKLTPAWYKKISCCLWLNEVDSLALANVQLNLNQAFQNFYNKKSRYPRFKKKSAHNDSYTTNNASIHMDHGKMYLSLPKMEKEVPVINHRPIKDGGQLKSATISREPDGAYYVSLLYEYKKVPVMHQIDPGNAVGLDMSMHGLYVDSEGNEVDIGSPYRKAEDCLAREQRKLSHMQKNSHNYGKQKQKIAKLYAKTKHQRNDALHQISRKLVNQYDIIGIEALNMKGMAQSLNFGKSVSDKGWGMFTAMLAYKAEKEGKRVIKVDHFFPSSQTCSHCGTVSPITKDLSVREWTCPVCGYHHNRDVNAAVNIKNEAVRIYCTC